MALSEREELELLELENENASLEVEPSPEAPVEESKGLSMAMRGMSPMMSLLSPRLGERSSRAFLGIPQTPSSGLAEGLAEFAGAEGLPTGLSIAGQVAGSVLGATGGAAAGAPAGLVGMTPLAIEGARRLGAAGAGLGAGLGTGIRGAVRMTAEAAGLAPKQTTLPGVATEVGSAAVKSAVGAYAIPKLMETAPAILDYMATSRIGGGIAKPAWEYLKKNTDDVMKYVGSGAEVADDIANNLRTAVSNSVNDLENLYRSKIASLESGKAGKMFLNFDKAIGDKLRYIAREDAGYTDPARLASTPEAGYFIQRFVVRAGNMTRASLTDIYNFQKDLNAAITDNISNSLGRNLLKVKDVVREMIDNTPALKPIAEANAAWHDAKTIDSVARAFTRKNDLIDYVRRVFGSERETLQKRAIEGVGRMAPEVAEEVANARALLAAQGVSPLLRGMTGTGLETAPGVFGTVAYGLKHPVWGMAALAASPLTSPRMYATALQYGGKLPNIAASPLTQAAAVGATSLADYYRRQSSSPR